MAVFPIEVDGHRYDIDARSREEAISALEAHLALAPAPAGPELSTGFMSLSSSVQDISPTAQAQIAPAGMDQAQFEQLPFDQRIVLKNREATEQQSRLREVLKSPDGTEPFWPTETQSPSGVVTKSYGDGVEPLQQTRARLFHGERVQVTDRTVVEENESRARGIETRDSDPAISGATVTLLNLVPPPSIVDPNDETQVNAFLEWKAKMKLGLAAGLKRDFGVGEGGTIGVEFDEESMEWVYLNPKTSKWTRVISRGMNTEDWGAIVKDPVQTGILAAEIAMSVGLAFATGGAGLVLGEGAIGAAGAAGSQYMRNKRAQELGFDRESSEGVPTAAGIGAVAGLAGGGIAAKQAGRISARNVAREALESRIKRTKDELSRARQAGDADEVLKQSNELRQIYDEVDAVADDIIEAEGTGIQGLLGVKARSEVRSNRVTQGQRQAELDRGMESLDRIRPRTPGEGNPPVVPPRATAGPGRPGSQADEDLFARQVRKTVEDALEDPRPQATINPIELIRNTLLKTAQRVGSMKMVRQMRGVVADTRAIAQTGRIHATKALNEITGKMTGTNVRNEIEFGASLPTRRMVLKLRQTIDTIKEDLGGLESPTLDRLRDSLGPLFTAVRSGDQELLNGVDAERIIRSIDNTLHDKDLGLIDNTTTAAMKHIRKSLVDDYARATEKFNPSGRRAVQNWARSSENAAIAKHGSDNDVILKRGDFDKDFFEFGGTQKELDDADIEGFKGGPQGKKFNQQISDNVDFATRISDPETGLSNAELLDALLRPDSKSPLSPKNDRRLDNIVDSLLDEEKRIRQLQTVEPMLSSADTSLLKSVHGTRRGIAREIASIVTIGIKESPERAVGAITELLTGRSGSRLLRIMGKDYMKDLQGVRTMLRKFGGINTGKVTEKTIQKAARSPVRNTLRRLGTFGGLASAALTIASGGTVPIIGAAVAGTAQLFRTSSKVVNTKATRAVARMLSDPTLLNGIWDMRLERANFNLVGKYLGDLSAAVSEQSGEPAQAAVVDGMVIPLTKEDGSLIATAEEWTQAASDAQKKLHRAATSVVK